MKSLNQIQDEIVEEFGVFDDWMDKYNYLIELARDLPIIDEKYKTNENIINGCQSKVWLNAASRAAGHGEPDARAGAIRR